MVICKDCGLKKTIYGKQKILKCVPCLKKYQKQYRKNNKEIAKQYGSEYRAKNKQEIKIKRKIYYNENCDEILIRNKLYNIKNKEEISAYQKEYFSKNKENIQNYRKAYRLKNKKRIKNRDRLYYINNRDFLISKSIKYRSNNKDKVLSRLRVYRAFKAITDPKFKLRIIVSGAILSGLKQRDSSKNKISCFEYLLFTVKQLKRHLESQFEPWMNWSNHGIYKKDKWDDNDKHTWTWHIDHIVPHSTFNYTSMQDEEFKKCWNLENLRPYSAKQNILDGDRKKSYEV